MHGPSTLGQLKRIAMARCVFTVTPFPRGLAKGEVASLFVKALTKATKSLHTLPTLPDTFAIAGNAGTPGQPVRGPESPESR